MDLTKNKAMRPLAIMMLVLILAAFTLYSPAPTKMRITVITEDEEIVVGASVEIFKTKEHYQNETNIVAKDTTNEKGYVEFKQLEERAYYVLVKKGHLNNHGGHIKTEVLSPVGKNRFLIMIN